jgi:hypothetical protein
MFGPVRIDGCSGLRARVSLGAEEEEEEEGGGEDEARAAGA